MYKEDLIKHNPAKCPSYRCGGSSAAIMKLNSVF